MRIVLIALALALLCPGTAAASLIVRVSKATVTFSPAAQGGSFEVYVQSSEPAPPPLSDFQVTLTAADPRIALTAVAKPIEHPYALESVGGFFFGDVLDGGATIEGGDTGVLSTAALENGAGLLRVEFQAAAGLPAGSYAVNFLTGANQSFLSGLSGDLPASFEGGSIVVVPEPATAPLLLAASGVIAWALLAHRRGC